MKYEMSVLKYLLSDQYYIHLMYTTYSRLKYIM